MKTGINPVQVPTKLVEVKLEVVREKSYHSFAAGVGVDVAGNISGGGTRTTSSNVNRLYLNFTNRSGRPVRCWRSIKFYSDYATRAVRYELPLGSPTLGNNESWRTLLDTIDDVVLSELRIIDPDTDTWIERHQLAVHLNSLATPKSADRGWSLFGRRGS